jgi:hypothetical protein
MTVMQRAGKHLARFLEILSQARCFAALGVTVLILSVSIPYFSEKDNIPAKTNDLSKRRITSALRRMKARIQRDVGVNSGSINELIQESLT